jgi:hypothetical protein
MEEQVWRECVSRIEKRDYELQAAYYKQEELQVLVDSGLYDLLLELFIETTTQQLKQLSITFWSPLKNIHELAATELVTGISDIHQRIAKLEAELCGLLCVCNDIKRYCLLSFVC